MNGMTYRRTVLLGLFLASLSFGLVSSLPGCAGSAVSENDPAALMQDAEEDIKGDHFQLALDKLRSIKNKFPYSKYSLEAQLRMADVYFMQEAFPEAAAAYESFADLHPKHEKVPYALFRAGKSYLMDSPDLAARDLTSAQKAVDAYTEFLRRFPQSPDATGAKEDVIRLRNQLAEKELYVGNFYFKRSGFRAAKLRYQKVLELFPESEAAKEAKEKLSGIDDKIRKEIEEENASAGRSASKGE